MMTAGIVVLAVAAYAVGYWRAQQVQRSAFDQQVRENTALEGERMRDPAVAPPLGSPAPIIPRPASSGAEGTGTGGGRTGPPPTEKSEAPRMGPIESDPREIGLHYITVATPPRDGAIKLAEFCRTEGLEAYVVAGHNAQSRRVILLPGFRSNVRTDPEIRSVLVELERVGRLWKSTHRGQSDLSDNYLSLHK